jgi:hypothetical protein
MDESVVLSGAAFRRAQLIWVKDIFDTGNMFI